MSTKKIRIAIWCLRIGLSFVFAYAAIEVYTHSENFLKYLPDMVQDLIDPKYFLPAFGIGEIILALWLLSGWNVHYAALISSALMVGIILPNLDSFHILFRNVAIGFAALALASIEWPDEPSSL